MIQSLAVAPVRRNDVSMWREQIKHSIFLFIFLPVIPTLTLQSNTNKAKEKRAIEEEEKKKQPNKPEHSTAAHTPNHCMSHVQRKVHECRHVNMMTTRKDSSPVQPKQV